MFKKTILLMCCTVILTFNFTMGYAKANGWAATFVEESAPAAFAGFMTTVTAVGASAMHTEQYIADNAKEIYDTALATWPSLSADMQANFKSSMTQMADGIIVAGDWITAGLDALKAKFGSADSNLPGINVSTSDIHTAVGFANTGLTISFYYDNQLFTSSSSADLRISYLQDQYTTLVAFSLSLGGTPGDVYKSYSVSRGNYETGVQLAAQAKSISSIMDLKNFIEATYGTSVVLRLDGNVINPDVTSPYNRMDQWLRDVAIPAGNLGVYTPNEAWTDKGYRLGLSTDGQNLLTLPDGLPYDPVVHGEYTWRPPLTQVIDGVPAVLDPLTWDWVNVRDRTKVRPAEIPEIAEYVGTDIDTAEKIRERDKGEGGETGETTGGLKNPTKKLVWTPLMMAGTAMTTKFPFSLPWDLMKQLQIFDVAPKAPEIEINVPNYLQMDGLSVPFKFTLDLSMFDKVATMVRWFNVIIWDIALILILRKLLPE